MRVIRHLLSACLLALLAKPAAAEPSQITIGNKVINVDPKYKSPTPDEIALMTPFQAEIAQWYNAAKTAKAPLRKIRECGKYAEEAKTPAERERWMKELAVAQASQDPTYLAYLQAERALNAKLGEALARMDQRQRLLNPLMNSYVRVVPYIDARENTIPSDVSALEKYRGIYEQNRSGNPVGAEAFLQWKTGQDPTFDELNAYLAALEQKEGFIPGFFHAIAWRESEGNPKQGAENADERGMFQVQSTDYQPEFGEPLTEPAGSQWARFEALCKWVPFNAALASHCYKRFVDQAEEYGFSGNDRFELAYRFYNESSGYILFCQHRLRIYRELFGLTPQDLPDNDIHLLNRFIYFTQDELRQMYDWKMPDGQIAGDALWNAWKNARLEITSDLVWKVLERRLIEQIQYYEMSIDEQGKRICTVDLTQQNVKRRGSPGIPGFMMAAIGICSARGVVPTAEICAAYFYQNLNPQAVQAVAFPAPVTPQPTAPMPKPLQPGMRIGNVKGSTPAAVSAMLEGGKAPQPPVMSQANPVAAPAVTPTEIAEQSDAAVVVGTPFSDPSAGIPAVATPMITPAATPATPAGATLGGLSISPSNAAAGAVTPLPAIPVRARATATPLASVGAEASSAVVAVAPSAINTPAVSISTSTPAPTSQPSAMPYAYTVTATAGDGPVEAVPVGPVVSSR